MDDEWVMASSVVGMVRVERSTACVPAGEWNQQRGGGTAQTTSRCGVLHTVGRVRECVNAEVCYLIFATNRCHAFISYAYENEEAYAHDRVRASFSKSR